MIAGGANESAIRPIKRGLIARTVSRTSERSVISSAAAVPAWSATSNAFRSSGSSCS